MLSLQQQLRSYFGITSDEFKAIEHLFLRHQLNKDSYFVKKKQYCKKLSFVEHGYIRVFANVKDKEVTQWITTSSYFITDLHSFFFDQRSRWNMQALTDCTLYTISKEDYKQLSNKIPNWYNVEKNFISSCFSTLEDRVFDHLSLNTEERYLKFFNQNKILFNEVPLQYLASMLGMTPETLSRIRKKINS
ncbi:Crp/Fnr family transcriptional regulator [uncultured Tenacibaculum sp.]|uniref:Crp/Fnr family transcriptional regulator n=1 Tax=Tenacibaculum sp. ZS6-P6 TaxID=3447503 RepID=UPI00261D4EA9|nr:Crp/Fnr family transcriptional regulator [uncultured Tenacibaculum sp.]